jgi:hypothetical protein
MKKLWKLENAQLLFISIAAELIFADYKDGFGGGVES